MVRNYSPDPIAPESLDRILWAANRAPSAGNTQGLDLVVLAGAAVETYWDVTLPVDRRATFPWPGLLYAPVLVQVVVSPRAYVERYGESDKEHTGLGRGADAWPVPFWFVDGGAAIMAMLLAAVDEGLGALLFGTFGHETQVKATFGVPVDRRIAGVIAMGHPADEVRPSRSTARTSRALGDVVHRGRWTDERLGE